MSTALKPMTVEEFLPWAEGQEGRWELHDGVPVMISSAEPAMMAPERAAHIRTKFRAAKAMDIRLAAVEKAFSELPTRPRLRSGTAICIMVVMPDWAGTIPRPTINPIAMIKLNAGANPMPAMAIPITDDMMILWRMPGEFQRPDM